jgi:hypothetical protein
MRHKSGINATVREPAYGPIFGNESDICVSDKQVYYNHHILCSSYERVEVKGIPN